MKINVKNFGPITNAEDITVSPITIFTGDENTKSYLSTIMYSAIESSFDAEYTSLFRNLLFRNLYDTENIDILSKKVVFGFIRLFKEEWKNKICSFLEKEGVDIVNDKNLNLTLKSKNENIFIDFNEPDNDRIEKSFLDDISDQIEESMAYYNSEKSESKKPIPFPRDVIGIFYNAFLKELHGDNFARPYFLSSVREDVMRNYIDMSKHAIKSFGGGNENQPDQYFTSSFYTTVAKNLINIDKEKIDNTDILKINKILESDILKGKIKVVMPEMGLPIFKYTPDGKNDNIDMKDVSESVAQLAPLSILMRYYLEKNSILFIENPEANLNSDEQKSLADVMVKLSNNGVLLVANTKSTVMLKQIETAVLASSSDHNKKNKDVSSENSESLNPENIKVYSIEKKTKSKKDEYVVKNVPFDFTNGFSIKKVMGNVNDKDDNGR